MTTPRSLTVATLLDIASRAREAIALHKMIDAVLVNDLTFVEDLCRRAIGGSNMGCAADEVLLSDAMDEDTPVRRPNDAEAGTP
jgi:hypothetical protein